MKTFNIEINMRPTTVLKLYRDSKDPVFCVRNVMKERKPDIEKVNSITIQSDNKKLEFLGNRV